MVGFRNGLKNPVKSFEKRKCNYYTGQHTNFAEDISTVSRCIRCADSENGLLFAELALVFEMNAFFMKILLTQRNSIVVRLCLF